MNVSRNRRLSRVLLAAAICGALTRAGVQAQTDYTYTVIADLSTCFNFGNPVINNNGEVAFGANCDGAVRIRRGEGGPLTPIFTTTFDSGTPNSDVISINDSGVVAFSINRTCGFNTAILTGDGGPIATVVDICTNPGPTEVHRPSISNTGAVAFGLASGAPGGFDFVIRAKNGAFVTIAGPGTSPTSVGSLTAAIEPSINNNDVVTFLGQGQTTFGLFTGAGGPVTTISLDNPSSFNGIDDSGRVAFVSNTALQTGDGGPVTTIATRTFEGGAYQQFTGGGASLSAAGRVAFMASLPSGVDGVFTGPNPEADDVLKAGDVIPGLGRVTNLSISREAINDSGQVAMFVIYEDSALALKRAIIRADPPNRPPVASDGSITTPEDTAVNGTLNASDPDGNPLTYSIVANGSKGTATITSAATGAFTYTPNPNVNGDDTFTFKVNDGTVDSLIASTETVSITPVNDAPVAVGGTASVSAGASVSGLLVATDVDSTFTYVIVTNGTKGVAAITDAGTGAYTYTAAAGSSGTDTFTFSANDGLLPSNVATVTVTINAVCTPASNISTSVGVTMAAPKLNRKTGRYTQTVTLKNNGGATSGPVSLVLDQLSTNATLFNAAGTTACAPPLGSPYINFQFSPGKKPTTVTLEFANPSGQPVAYTARVLAGPGSR